MNKQNYMSAGPYYTETAVFGRRFNGIAFLALLALVMAAFTACSMGAMGGGGADDNYGKDFVKIKGGTFNMGSPTDEPGRHLMYESQHSVTLSDFYISKYEVTQKQYEDVMGSNPSMFTSGASQGEVQEKRPVEKVKWYNAIVFCNKFSVLEGFTPVYTINGSTNPDDWGAVPTTNNNSVWDAVTCDWSANGYRLPTEAEWEYACRAGTVSAFNTGAAISDNTGWCFNIRINNNFITHEGGKKSANAWGLYDMHGNVFEWVWDWFESNYSPGTSDPRGPASGSSRVSRGGGIFSMDYDIRSAARACYPPGFSGGDLGFRLAASGSGGSK